MGAARMRRVDEAIRQVIGEALAREIKDPRVGFVTVTDVSTSADLRHAHVHVSVLGDEAQREDSISGLQSAHGFLQAKIARELHLKRTPALDFHHDLTTDRAMRVEELLGEHEAHEHEREHDAEAFANAPEARANHGDRLVEGGL
jgi:ribosome-binding factor A